MNKQRGMAVLVLTMALLFASLLATLYVNRNLIIEQRSSSDQYRSTQAFEAAEAGIEWALALLNDPQRIGTDCLTSSNAASTSFRGRYVGAAAPLRPSCVLAAGAWSCSCPTSGPPTLAAPAASAGSPAPAFMLSFSATPTFGVTRLLSTGCTALAGACVPGSLVTVDATANVAVEIGALPALRSAPAAALTTRGTFDSGAASVGLANADPSTGLALQSGGHVAAPNVRWSGPLGGSSGSLLVADDASLASSTVDRFFASYFGLSKAAWKAQPGVRHLRCDLDCNTALIAAVAAAPDGASIWVDGDLRLTGPLSLGTTSQPVAIVIDGAARFTGAVALTGLVHAAKIEWKSAGADSAGFVHGAVLSEDSYSGDAAPDIVYDVAVLATLRARPAAFARVSGSWHDL